MTTAITNAIRITSTIRGRVTQGRRFHGLHEAVPICTINSDPARIPYPLYPVHFCTNAGASRDWIRAMDWLPPTSGLRFAHFKAAECPCEPNTCLSYKITLCWCAFVRMGFMSRVRSRGPVFDMVGSSGIVSDYMAALTQA